MALSCKQPVGHAHDGSFHVCKGNCHILLQLNEHVVEYQLGEQMLEMLRHMLQVEALYATIPRTVKQYHDQHDFCLGKCPVMVVRTLIWGFYGIFAIIAS